MWDEITHPFPNFNCYIVVGWERISNFSHTLLGMWILIRAHVAFRVKPVVLETGVNGHSVARHDLLATQSNQFRYLLNCLSRATSHI